MRAVRLGVVGCGEVARQVHLPALERVPEIDVVAFADSDPDRLAAAGQVVPGASRHAEAETLVADPAVAAAAAPGPPPPPPPGAAAPPPAGHPPPRGQPPPATPR